MALWWWGGSAVFGTWPDLAGLLGLKKGEKETAETGPSCQLLGVVHITLKAI